MNSQIGRAGSLESCDVLITVFPTAPGRGRDIRLESLVIKQFGEQIRTVILEELDKAAINGIVVEVRDRGAFDYTIKSRLQTALKRAGLLREDD